MSDSTTWRKNQSCQSCDCRFEIWMRKYKNFSSVATLKQNQKLIYKQLQFIEPIFFIYLLAIQYKVELWYFRRTIVSSRLFNAEDQSLEFFLAISLTRRYLWYFTRAIFQRHVLITRSFQGIQLSAKWFYNY